MIAFEMKNGDLHFKDNDLIVINEKEKAKQKTKTLTITIVTLRVLLYN